VRQNGWQLSLLDERATAGRAPIRNRFFGEHRAAMAADSFHSFKSNGSSCAAPGSVH
jgi:hypothetical protein